MQNLSKQTIAVTLAGPDEEKFTNYLQMILATINEKVTATQILQDIPQA
jgi:hypothetical protein